MSRELLVSIIINNYNYARFLDQAIDSALSQTYRAVEVIVVDDGSTDHSRDVIARYGERVIPLFKKNGGQASAFNAGFAQSRGEMIIFLDADDLLLPDIVRRVAEVFQSQPQVAKVMYRMELIDGQGMHSGIVQPPLRLLRRGDLRRHVLTFPFDMTWMATSGNAFAARVLRRILPMPEAAYGRILADWYLSHLAPLFGEVVFLADVGFYYRVHDTNHYQWPTEALDLERLRQTILYAHKTCIYIKKFADELNLVGAPHRADDLLSVSLMANRVASLKLDPMRHPLQGDRLPWLCWLGVVAASRRFDVSVLLRIVFALWFVAMLVAPKPLAYWLTERFFFAEKRRFLESLLGLMHLHPPSRLGMDAG